MNELKSLSPPEVIQIISIYNCINALSDYLFENHFLSEVDQYKQIPIVNALSHYLEYNSYDRIGKSLLTQAILKNSDLYGEMPNEILDEYYMTALINHIVEIFVFEDYGNVQGYLAYIVRKTKFTSTLKIHEESYLGLSLLTFENEDGPNSMLMINSINYIMHNLIDPHFLQLDRNHNIFSVEYIYALSGLSFVQSMKLIDKDVYEKNLYDVNNKTQADIMYQQYIGIALSIEHAVTVDKLEPEAMRIFSFSALCYYLFIEDDFVKLIDTKDIVADSYYWSLAYDYLFKYLSNTFAMVKKSQEEDYKQQFYLSLYEYKNHSALATFIMQEENCLNINNDEIENYQAIPNNSFCTNDKEEQIVLPNLNELFEEQNLNIKYKHYNFENNSIYEEFGETFIKTINNLTVIIYKIICDDFNNTSKDDFLMFDYLNNTVEYYILSRTELKLKLYSQINNPEIFVEPLFNLDLSKSTAIRLKNTIETFDDFSNAIASKRSTTLFENLNIIETHHVKEKTNFWIEFSLSLLPFYSCITEIKEQTIPISCLMDAVFLIPGIGTLSGISLKLMSSTLRAFLSSVGLTIRTVTLRLSFQSTLKFTARTVGQQFSGIFTKKIALKVGKELLRIIDPGFELIYLLSKSSIKIMKMLLNIAEIKNLISFESIKLLLARAREIPTIISKKLNQLYDKADVYVNSLSTSNFLNSGYKYIKITNKEFKATLRSIPYSNAKKPVIKIGANEYSAFDVLTGKTYGPKLILEHNIFQPKIVHTPSSFDKNVKHISTADRKHKLRDHFQREELQILKIIENKKMPKEAVLKQFKQYNFPNQDNAIKFIDDILNTKNLEAPAWCAKYKINEPELFFQLKFAKYVDKSVVIHSKLESRINQLYSSVQMQLLGINDALENLVEIYDRFSAYELVKFEDFLAINFFLFNGYKNMTKSTDITRRMKNALYRIAIRQLDDSDENFTKILYTWELKSKNAWTAMSLETGIEFIFRRFILASKTIPPNYSFADDESKKILYKINFKGQYLRASIEELHFEEKFDTVLLPDTKFKIINIRSLSSSLYGTYNEVTLEYVYNSDEILKSQQNIMTKIKELKRSNTVFYHDYT
ncbi:uncharacterized protein LOC127276789 [Leptopilina boulardi]|uniref:uncharacterized protein LOC127276789 n=1 Tax=Leptopilina boulardi TaxID=63433 RepID=UPI0021F578CA|nr:uncharacterized protein LOC127276789 [Leptopilina boulardi]